MKEINRAFAMKMLEVTERKPAEQIEEEADNNPDEWPMGRYELEQTLGACEGSARFIIDYYKGRRPSEVTRKDVEKIHCQRANKTQSGLTEDEIESRKRNISLIFDIYEGD